MNSETKDKSVKLGEAQELARVLFNKTFGNRCVCSTAAATQKKEVTLGTTFDLVVGATILVKFTNAISVANATLEVTHTPLGAEQAVTEAAKAIYLNGAALSADTIPAGAVLTLNYNGTQFDIVGGAGEDMDDVVAFDSYDGNAQYPDIDAVLDTVHTKQQTLTESQKSIARTNIDAISAPTYDHVYNEVEDTTGKNPSQEGWYELDDDEYVLTEDTTPASGKTYYEQADYYQMII